MIGGITSSGENLRYGASFTRDCAHIDLKSRTNQLIGDQLASTTVVTGIGYLQFMVTGSTGHDESSQMQISDYEFTTKKQRISNPKKLTKQRIDTTESID